LGLERALTSGAEGTRGGAPEGAPGPAEQRTLARRSDDDRLTRLPAAADDEPRDPTWQALLARGRECPVAGACDACHTAER